ncbi:hypothetical protein E2C01_028465 [Portunus trituberculatus]|uniref:Uncharacterized protein n=1 Tax=Portunus trituberculatus TaxID=210409 RepID=A0A5B7ENQ2_PORTR|nr:hypothetical protein [Portunus trituberculatus]
MGGLEELIREPRFQQMARGSQGSKGVRDMGVHQRGRMSTVTRFKQSVTLSHGKERKAHQDINHCPPPPWPHHA